MTNESADIDSVNQVTYVSGGVNLEARYIAIAGDVVGRDKIVQNTITAIYQRALTAYEEAILQNDLEQQHLAKGVTKLAENLKALAVHKPTQKNPYKGLEEYRLGDSELFCGRDEDVRKILGHLDRGPLVVLHSASGTGKTSLWNAGIAPYLIAAGHLPLYVRPYDKDPVKEIKEALISDLRIVPGLESTSLRDFLHKVCEILGRDTHLYICIDQFEELFTLLDQSRCACFFEELRECLDDHVLRVQWVFALREEFFSRLSSYGDLLKYRNHNEYRLERFTLKQAHGVIAYPAKLCGISFDSDLIYRILSDLGNQEIVPPEVQLVCTALFDALKPEQRAITRSLYYRLGTAKAILGEYLNRAVNGGPSDSSTTTASLILEALVSSSGQRTRRTLADLQLELGRHGVDASETTQVVRYLLNSRVIRINEPNSPSDTLSYELIHDYLAERIKLTPATQARKAAQELLDSEVRSYHNHATLISEDRLLIVEQYYAQLSVTAEAKRLINESRLEIQKARTARERRRKVVVALALSIALAMTLLGMFGLNQSQESQRQAATAQAARNLAVDQQKAATSRELASYAMSELSIDPELSLLLSLEAIRTATTNQAVESLRLSVPQSNLIRVLSGHQAPVAGAIYSPDGKYILTAGDIDRTARVWNADTGEVITIAQSPDTLTAIKNQGIAFSPDGKKIAAVTYSSVGSAIIWGIHTGVVISELSGHTSYVSSVKFSPDGKLILTSSIDNTARIWDSGTGKTIAVMRGHTDGLNDATFSNDGKLVVTASRDGTARIWEANTGRLLRVLRGHQSEIWSARFSPDGKHVVTASTDRTARIWTVADGHELHRLRGHQNDLTETQFSPDGQYVCTASRDGTAMVWNADSGQLVSKLVGHQGWVWGIEFSPDGRYLVTASKDGTARIWEAATGKVISVLRGHRSVVNSASFSPDGRFIATSSADGTARIWRSGINQASVELLGHTGQIDTVAYSPDGNYLVTPSFDGTAKIWEAKSGRMITNLIGHTGALYDAEFSPDGHLIVTASDDKTARVWDVRSGHQIAEMRGHGSEPLNNNAYEEWRSGIVMSAVFSPDGQRVLTAGSDGTARIWETLSGKLIYTLGESKSVMYKAYATFSPDGKLVATVGGDANVYLWNAATGTLIREYKGHRAPAVHVAFSPDGQQIVSAGSDGLIGIWNVSDDRLYRAFYENVPPFYAEFSHDGKLIVAAIIDGKAHVWDVVSGRTISEMRGHGDGVASAKFSPNDNWIVTASMDATARIWEAATGIMVKDLHGHSAKKLASGGPATAGEVDDGIGGVVDAIFSPDGKTIATAGTDGKALIFDCGVCVNLDELIDLAQSRATRTLTCDERNIYLHEKTACPEPTPNRMSAVNVPTATPEWSSTVTPKLPATVTPVYAKQSEIVDSNWRTEVYNLPDGLQLEDSAIIQCREKADSSTLVQDYTAIWAIRTISSTTWVSNGKASIVLAKESGENIASYDVDFRLGPSEVGWLRSSENSRGNAMRSKDAPVKVFKVIFDNISWNPIVNNTNQYSYTMKLAEHSTFGNSSYAQHKVKFTVQNLSNLIMQNGEVLVVVKDSTGNTVDILKSLGSFDVNPNSQSEIEAKSASSTGRCVGQTDPHGYNLHVWFDFESDLGQTVTKHLTVAVP